MRKEAYIMISIKNLKKIYTMKEQKIHAVDSITLDIAEGDIFGVIGYSGAGKSTFVRLLNRLENPTEGSVVIDDKEMTRLKGKSLRVARQDIGMIFQHFNLLWSRTTEENIAFPLEIAGVPKEERIKRQEVWIARAMANNAKVLLCDEATSELDPDTTNAILDLLVDINKKLHLTIVMITHEMHVIRKICDKVAVMEAGKVVEQGNVI